jgi:hypothetical protein
LVIYPRGTKFQLARTALDGSFLCPAIAHHQGMTTPGSLGLMAAYVFIDFGGKGDF